LTWTPKSTDEVSGEPAKPSKLGFAGFDGSPLPAFEKITARFPRLSDTEEPSFEGFEGAGVAAFSIDKGSGGPSDAHDGLSPTSESEEPSDRSESGRQKTTGADGASGLLPIIPTPQPSAPPQPEDDWEDL
jgi:hypothetical protein